MLAKLLGGSIALHFLLAVAVMYVPGVRDAFKLASLIAETRFVDKPYDKTVIGDDVQLIELANDKFHYPEGYFAPENQVAQLPPVVPPPPFIAQS